MDSGSPVWSVASCEYWMPWEDLLSLVFYVKEEKKAKITPMDKVLCKEWLIFSGEICIPFRLGIQMFSNVATNYNSYFRINHELFFQQYSANHNCRESDPHLSRKGTIYQMTFQSKAAKKERTQKTKKKRK